MQHTGNEANVWLDVPYNEKEEAKDYGARWDPDKKAWFTTATNDPIMNEKLQRWLPKPRIYLTCDFYSKDAVKLLGGRWDARERKWYVTEEMDLEPFADWVEHPIQKKVPTF